MGSPVYQVIGLYQHKVMQMFLSLHFASPWVCGTNLSLHICDQVPQVSKPSFHGGRGEQGEFHGVGLGWELSPDAELSGNSAIPIGVFINDLKGPC